MKTRIFTLLLPVIILLSGPAAVAATLPADPYARLWKKVDSLTGLNQPKSALAIVDKIYRQARAENNDPQAIKSVIYRIRLNSEFQENFMKQTITGLRQEIAVAGEPSKQVLQSILAEVYWKYYQNNQYRYRDRTRTVNPVPDSIETWDLQTIAAAVTRNYLLSLQNAGVLKSIPVTKFEAILDIDPFEEKPKTDRKAEAARFNPTLYDFLANRALAFFTSASFPVASARRFEADQPWYFHPTEKFIRNGMMIPADTTDPKSFAPGIFRDLAAFHLQDKDPRALIETELKRLEFVHDAYILPGSDSLYMDALQQLGKTNLASPWSAGISFTMASFLNSRGGLYNPAAGKAYRWDLSAALEICHNAMKRHPGSEGAKNCAILAETIKGPSLQVTSESGVPVEKSSPALVQFRNLHKVFFRLVKTDPSTFSDRSSSVVPAEFFKSLAKLPAVRSWSQELPDAGDFQQHSVEMPVPGVPAGFYVLLGSSADDFSNPKQVFTYTPIWSTQISYISKRNDDGSLGYYILDRETGMPLKDVRLESWTRVWNSGERKMTAVRQQDYRSDSDGYFSIPSPEERGPGSNMFLKIYHGADFLITENYHQYPQQKAPERSYLQTMFYTDRGIYRPGQVIYFRGIILERTGDRSAVKASHPAKVVLTDVNGRKVAEQHLVSNAFGSFNGTFTAPQGVLPGQMAISSESGSVSFSVEEYKRPTFEVTCDPMEGNYKLGEPLEVKGKASAYAGNVLSGATVRYHVVRSARFPFREWGWYRPIPVSPDVEIASGVTTTDPDGRFAIAFPAIPDRSVDAATKPVFDFVIDADVTDINGETQSVRESISVGYNSLLLGSNFSDMVSLAADSVLKISATNLNGKKTAANVTVTLYKLRQPGRILKPRSWARPDTAIMTAEKFHEQFPNDIYGDEDNPENWAKESTVFERTLNTSSDSVIRITDPGSRIADPGSYLLVLKATDPFGQPVEIKQFFTAFSPESKEVPLNVLNWFVPLKTSGEPGESARFLIGSKEDNVHVIYEVRHRDSLVSREWIRLSNKAVIVGIPILEKYRGNFTVNFLFVRHNRAFQNSQLISVPYTNKKLAVSIASFRSKLDPGAKETWTVTITRPGGKPASAEFMAGMYDASLDRFRANDWTFAIYEHYSGLSPWTTDHAFRTSTGMGSGPAPVAGTYSVHPVLKLNWFGLGYFDYSGRNPILMRSGARQAGAVPMSAEDKMVAESGSMAKGGELNEVITASDVTRVKPKPAPAAMMQVRRDFRETAFFYPAMVTDTAGNLIMQFTVPESLTRWKMQGLAHTRDLEYGLIEKELVTQKVLMIFPNAPRFLRQGDTAVLSAKITNLSEQDLAGEAKLELADAITELPADSLVKTPRSLTFSVPKGQGATVTWKIAVPVSPGLSLLRYRITAVSGNFSDGEEKALPVLTNRMLVTESLPLPVRGKGSTEFSFDKLIKSGSTQAGEQSLKNYRLTLEFASNPAWYAIQTLPSLNDRQYDHADAVFSAYWSNSLASHIANSNPKIKAVFEAWKNLTPDALQSNLEKNQDLKTALLQETPWVNEAADETGRKQKLGLYFDGNTIESNLRENLAKLQKLQTPGGGWTWFPGMPENRFTTQSIVTGLGKLHHLGVQDILKDPETRAMLTRAIAYLDREILKDYENLKRHEAGHPEGKFPGSSQVQYLYARSFFMTDSESRIPKPASKVKEAFDFYIKQAEKSWQQGDRTLQGMTALALHRLDRKEVPALIVKSLSERALRSPEMGMYWAEEHGFWWHEAPVEAQAMMIETFDEVSYDSLQVEEMKIWLLKQKQTQDWRSSRATLEACYALLLRGTDLLAGDPGVKIMVGKQKINPATLTDVKQEAGTGYFRYSWDGSAIDPSMGKITVSKSTPGVAWGALYWQYFEDLDRITPAATPLKLEKKLFIERNTPNGPVLEPISKEEGGGKKEDNIDASLKIGDKVVVRIVVTVDRDLEFVHMKDLRASAFEPVTPASRTRLAGGNSGELSGYRWQDGLGYYQAITDQAVNFFFDYLPKGTYVFEYALLANTAGEYSNGVTTIQCLYAPEFTAHSEGIRVMVR